MIRDIPNVDEAGSRTQRRFQHRARLAMRHGFGVERARNLAEALARRDAYRDDRRMCIECRRLRPSGRCQAAMDGLMRGASTRYEPVPDLLQRCANFSWELP